MTKNETSYTTIFHHNRPQLLIKKIRRTSYFRHKLRTRESKYLFSNREEDVVNDSLNDTREAKPNENYMAMDSEAKIWRADNAQALRRRQAKIDSIDKVVTKTSI